MSITTDIASILARVDISGEEKRLLIYQLKSGKVAEAALSIVGKNVNLGSGYSVRVTQAPSVNSRGDLILFCTGTHNGTPLVLDLPIVVRNVPVVDGGNENPLAAIRTVVLRVLQRAG